MLQCPQNEVLTPWPGICALYNLPISCCSLNCSMFQLAVLLAVAQALSVPSSLWAYRGHPPSFKAFLLPSPQPEISSSLNINCTWFLWHLLHIDSCFIIHDLCFSSSLVDSNSFHSKVHVDFNSVSGVLPVMLLSLPISL